MRNLQVVDLSEGPFRLDSTTARGKDVLLRHILSSLVEW